MGSDLSDLPDFSSVSGVPDVLVKDNGPGLPAIMGILACPGLRADVLDVLSAAHFEFTNVTHGNDVFMHIQALARDFMEMARGDVADTDLADAINNVVVDDSGMIPIALQTRLRDLLYLP